MIDGKIYLTDKNTLKILKEINNVDKKKKNRIRVKNGFATLNDKFFIIDDYVEKYGSEDANMLSVTKASNGEKHYFFYPYDKEGNPMSLLDIDEKLVEYMRDKSFDYDVDLENCAWYLYGRSQAIRDVKYNKIVVNNVVRNVDDIKTEILINFKDSQNGVYSGYYIPLYEYDCIKIDKILKLIENKKFVQYVKAVGKYKNGGYYTFSSKELELWLNYCFEKQ
jgi:adenine-specific DNA-methyltransferase